MGRAVWFVGGVATGVAGVRYTKRKVTAAAEKLKPANVAQSASDAMSRGVHRVADAVKEGVVEGRRRERELKAERDGRLVRLSDHLSDGDELLVDGDTVESGRVIVMRQRDPGQ
jgi:hypothetical protein